MATDVRVELPITRARADVAAYMFDPANDAEWTSGVIAVNPLTPGRLRVGSRVERTVKFLGKRFAYTYEVVDAREDAFVEMTVTQPFPMHVRYELESIDAHSTRVAIHARGDARGLAVGGLFKLTEYPREDQNREYRSTALRHWIVSKKRKRF